MLKKTQYNHLMNFEANRRKILEDIKRQRIRKKVSTAKHPSKYFNESAQINNGKQRVAVFGNKSLFLNNLIASLSHAYTIEVFNDVDKATDYIVEKAVKFVIIDIDPPSEYHCAATLLTVLKTLCADALLFICTKDKNESRAKALFLHGGIILEKPISIPDFIEFMKTGE